MIERLDPETRNEIAAGEVITRPERAVTELVENALDAGAERIDVTVEGDGTERIVVADDGRGMSADDAQLAVERHATSKLADVEGVERVRTLGFRGEALASIAEAAARLTVTTNDGGPEGVRATVADGERTVEPAGRARGTTVEVEGLFADWPARRESLAGSATEFGRIADAVGHYALVRPDVAFTLTHDGGETLSTPGAGSYADAALGVYDRTVARRSTAFEGETTVRFEGTDRPIRVEGLLVYPSIARASRDHVHAAVNGRAVDDGTVRGAVLAGYGSLLPDGRAPIAIATVEVPPGFVDANVHPAKERVAFRDADVVAGAVETAVSDALTTADLRRSGEVAMDLDASLAPVESEESVLGAATVVGQYRELYLLCEADDDLLIVDQHAAHERINYERLRAAVAGGGDAPADEGNATAGEDADASADGGVPSVPLDPPETVSLTAGEAAAVEAHAEGLARLGFDLADFGGGTYRLRAVPAPLGRAVDAAALRDTLDALRSPSGDAGDGRTPAERRDDLLKDLACHPSLKAGDPLDREAAADLLDRLDACEQPFACPHGRPTVLSIEEPTLARGFERENTRLG